MSDELNNLAMRALASCVKSGYRDVDGDWVVTYHFDTALVEQALGQMKYARPVADAGEADTSSLMEGWRLVEKKTHFQLNCGNAVVATLAGPDAEENAAIISRVLSNAAKPPRASSAPTGDGTITVQAGNAVVRFAAPKLEQNKDKP